MDYEAGFKDEDVKKLQQRLFTEYPVEVQVMALYEMLEGRPESAKAICKFRQRLADEFLQSNVILPSRLKVEGTLSVTHPNGQLCIGKDCTYFSCANSK